MEFLQDRCHSKAFQTCGVSALVTVELKSALRGICKLLVGSPHAQHPASTGHTATVQAHLPDQVQQVCQEMGTSRSNRIQRELLVVHACLTRILGSQADSLLQILRTGGLPLSTLEQLFSDEEYALEQHEILKMLRQSNHFHLLPGKHPADYLPTYELAQHWLSRQALWAVQKLLDCLPTAAGEERSTENRYIRSLIACTPLPAEFRVPVRLAIEIALLAHETDHLGHPVHDLENRLRAQMYAVPPAQSSRDAASIILTDYRNRRLALLNHGLVSHQGALEVFHQIQTGEVPPLLACNVLSSFIRMELPHSDDLLFQMAEFLNTQRLALHPSPLKKVAAKKG